MIFDTHAHYDDRWFDEDREKVLREIREAGVMHFVNIASDLPSVDRTLGLLENHPEAFCALGIHPSDIGGLTEEDFIGIAEKIRRQPRAVAVGEIGLDYHWGTEEDRPAQDYWFRYQLDMARPLDKPVVIHTRDAAQDTLRIMKEMRAEEIGGVVHCFSYSAEMAEEYVKMGFFIGVGGVVTFKNGKKLKEVVRRIPLSSIVLETDCPYLAPMPHRQERNQSSFLPLVIREIAELKEIPEEEVRSAAWENAHRLYRLPH